MHKSLFVLWALLTGLNIVKAQVKIGSAGIPNTNAVLELDGGTSKGLLLPKLTNAEITALTTAPDGLVVYNKTDNFLYIRKAAAWQKISDATNGGGFSLPYTGTASTVGGAEFSLTHTTTFGDVAYFNNTAGGSAITTANGNNKLNMTGGNTGIGIPAGNNDAPSLGRLVVRGSVGAVSAMFGDNTAGVSVMNNFPSIGFNYYYSVGSRAISTGFGSAIGQDPSSGRMYLSSSATSITGAGAAMPLTDRLNILANGNIGIATGIPVATLQVARGGGVGGTAQFDGTNYSSHFNYSTTEETFIRGGKPTSPVSINDLGTGNIRMARSGGLVGIGNQVPTATLHVSRGSAVGGTLRIDGTSTASHFNINTTEDTYIRGGKATSQVMVNDVSSGNIRLAEGGGNVGIGTATPTNKLTVRDNSANAAAQFLQNANGYAVDALSTNGTAIHALSYNLDAPAISVQGGSASIVTDGSIGVGISNPSLPLSFATALGKKISLYHGSTGDVGFGVFGNELRIHSDNSFAAITFGYDSYTNGFKENVRINGNGNVGIGVVPSYPLDIKGRLRLRNTGPANTAGIWLDGTASELRSFIGTNNENLMGFYGAGVGWNFLMDVNDGAIMIGTAQKATGYKVNIGGKVIAEEVRVQLRAAWPDYVFDEGYKKLSLDELDEYVKINKHLPNIPSAKEIEKDGHLLGETQRRMLEKIEELSLYIIELKKEIDEMKQQKTND